MELLLARPKPNEKTFDMDPWKLDGPGWYGLPLWNWEGAFYAYSQRFHDKGVAPKFRNRLILSRIKQVSTTTSLLWRTRPAGIILDVYFKVWKLWEMHSLFGSSSKSLTSKLRGWMIKNGRLCGTVGSPIFCDPAQVMLGSTVQKWVPCFFWGGASITQRTKATMFVKEE